MRWFGAPGYVVKFLAAACFVMLIGGAAVSLYYRKTGLAVACAITGGWAILMFFEMLKLEMVDAFERGQERHSSAAPSQLSGTPQNPKRMP